MSVIQLKQFYKTGDLIGSGEYLFRRFSSTPLTDDEGEKFARFLDGTLTEMIPGDFEGMTFIGNCSLCYFDELVAVEMADSITSYDSTIFMYCPKLERIKLSNNITTIDTVITAWVFNSLKEIVFPANLTSVINSLFNTTTCKSDVILDFSNCKSVPSFIIPSGYEDIYSFENSWITMIKVPSALYSKWISTSGWSRNAIKSKIVAV